MNWFLTWLKSDKAIKIRLGFTNYIYESVTIDGVKKKRFAFGFKRDFKYRVNG